VVARGNAVRCVEFLLFSLPVFAIVLMSHSRVSATDGVWPIGNQSQEESKPLGSRVPLMSEEFEASEPSGTRTVSSHSTVSLDSTTPLSPNHPLTHVLTTPTPTRVSFHTRYRGTSELILDTDSEGDELGEVDTEEDESSDADDERENQGLDDEGQGLEDVGPCYIIGGGSGCTWSLIPHPQRLGAKVRASLEYTPLITLSRLVSTASYFVADIDRDVRELYTRSGAALEAWAGQTDAQRAALWHAIYDIQRENHDLRKAAF
ncbi:hypothetical protein Tco_0089868, partial [Tanacetum coccineum]